MTRTEMIEKITIEAELEIENIIKLEKALNKISNETLEKIVTNVNKLRLIGKLINKFSWSFASQWFSEFKGKVYAFEKFYNKSFIKKYPNYVIEI